jgi:hypothetical protein
MYVHVAILLGMHGLFERLIVYSDQLRSSRGARLAFDHTSGDKVYSADCLSIRWQKGHVQRTASIPL